MSTDTARTFAQAKHVLDELQKKPDLLWAIFTMLPSVRLAGPWTAHPKGGVYRPTLARGPDGAVHVWPILGGGPLVYTTEYSDGGKVRSADDYDTLLARADDTLRARGWSLVGSTEEAPPPALPLPPTQQQVAKPWDRDPAGRPRWTRQDHNGTTIAIVQGKEPNGHTDWSAIQNGKEVRGAEIGIDNAKNAADAVLQQQGYSLQSEEP